jgi:SAM-dependent methyltransferase
MPWPIGDDRGDGKRLAQTAERNKGPILEVLRRALPATGLVLEIASGTGQHITHFARALPSLEWQPTDIDPQLRRSVEAWIRDEGLANVRAPIALDVHDKPWPVAHADAVICINMIHVAPWQSTLDLFEGARSVDPAVVVLYGPYRRFGAHTAPSNEHFDASLKANDPSWGVRDLEAVEEIAGKNGFELIEVVSMPANNFTVVFKRQAREG